MKPIKNLKLFKVTYERTSYQGTKSTHTTELFAESKDDINTYRLGGFQRDSIEIIECEFIRDRRPIELDADIERNELLASVDVYQFLNETLDFDESFNDEILELCERDGIDTAEALEALGYVERVHDNTYNYCSDLSDDLDFKVYTKGDDDCGEWYYNDTAVVLVRVHEGLDARCGYRELGVFSSSHYDGLTYFLDIHVRVEIMTLDYKEVGDSYDGDGAVYRALKDYTLKEIKENGEVIVNRNDESDTEDYILAFYTPAYGV